MNVITELQAWKCVIDNVAYLRQEAPGIMGFYFWYTVSKDDQPDGFLLINDNKLIAKLEADFARSLS